MKILPLALLAVIGTGAFVPVNADRYNLRFRRVPGVGYVEKSPGVRMDRRRLGPSYGTRPSYAIPRRGGWGGYGSGWKGYGTPCCRSWY